MGNNTARLSQQDIKPGTHAISYESGYFKNFPKEKKNAYAVNTVMNRQNSIKTFGAEIDIDDILNSIHFSDHELTDFLGAIDSSLNLTPFTPTSPPENINIFDNGAFLDDIIDNLGDIETKHDLSFVKSSNIIDSIENVFLYKKQLGFGVSGRVLLCEKIEDGKLYAMKEMPKSDPLNITTFINEVSLLRKLQGHKNIVIYNDCYIDDDCFYILQEICNGGTMLERIQTLNFFSEKQAAEHIRIILETVQYMHSKDIVHRDLKAENIVFDKTGTNSILKIIDFGSSTIINEQCSYNNVFGSVPYLPPEIMRSRNAEDLKKGDIWQVGIIAFILLSGKFPFGGKSKAVVMKAINKGRIQWPMNVHLSNECKSFIRALLNINVNERLSASLALGHEWIINKACNINLGQGWKENIKQFNFRNNLQSIIVNAILSEMTDDDVDAMFNGLKTFNNLDMNEIFRYLITHSNIEDIDCQMLTKQETMKVFTHILTSSMKYNIHGGINSKSDSYCSSVLKIVGDDEKILISDNLDLDILLDEIELEIEKECKSFSETEEKKMQEIVSNDKFLYDENESVSELEMYFSAGSPMVDRNGISASKFRAIMSRASKLYKIDDILNILDPENTGFIDVESISNYDKPVAIQSTESIDLSNTR